jgi:hypothetical protein
MDAADLRRPIAKDRGVASGTGFRTTVIFADVTRLS